MEDLFKRIGTFKISRPLIMEEPKAVLEILKDVLIVKLDNDFITDSIIYYGYSKHFEIIEASELPPTYYADIAKQPDGITIKWHREKEYSEKDVKEMFKEIIEQLKKWGI